MLFFAILAATYNATFDILIFLGLLPDLLMLRGHYLGRRILLRRTGALAAAPAIRGSRSIPFPAFHWKMEKLKP